MDLFMTKYALDGWNPAKGSFGNSGTDVYADLNGSGTLTSRYLLGDGVDQCSGPATFPNK